MKTTVELPQALMEATRKYANDHDKTFKEVLTEALHLYVGTDNSHGNRPGWESFFGAFRDDPEILFIQRVIDEEFSKVDPGDWL